jgi:hypothetical protein
MTEGRHSLPRNAAAKGHAAAKGGARKATGGARKATVKATAPATARGTARGTAKPTPVAGRRIAHKPSAVAVIRAGSVGTLTAVAPLAVLSVACVVGLGASPGEPASAKGGVEPQPLVPANSPFAFEHRARHRALTPDRVQTEAVDTASTTAAASSTPSESVGIVASPQAGEVPTTAPQPTAAPSVVPSVAPSPTVEPTPSLPVATSTAAPLTEAEATAQCLAEGVSALDVVGLANCVTDLLNP